jgi:hypothetical protein
MRNYRKSLHKFEKERLNLKEIIKTAQKRYKQVWKNIENCKAGIREQEKKESMNKYLHL